MRDGSSVQEVFTRKIFAKTICGVPMSAIQITTAGAMCAVLDLFREEAAAARFRASGAGLSLRDFPSVNAPRFSQLYEGQTLDSLHNTLRRMTNPSLVR